MKKKKKSSRQKVYLIYMCVYVCLKNIFLSFTTHAFKNCLVHCNRLGTLYEFYFKVHSPTLKFLVN